MPSLSVNVPHSLGQEEATQRLKDGFQKVMDEFGQHISDFQEEWNGDTLGFSFKTFGSRIKGTVTATESEVKVDAGLPLAAMMVKGMIEQRIHDELGKVLA